MNQRVAAPHHWLDPLVAALDSELAGRGLEGAVSGPGWISVRVGGRFLWLYAHGNERMVWLAERPLTRVWLELLGRHARSPFPAHLKDRRVEAVRLLETKDGQADGLSVELGPSEARTLKIRFFPRPGGIWLSGSDGEELARQGRMDDSALVSRPGRADDRFVMSEHGDACEASLEAALHGQTLRAIRQQVEREAKRHQRKVWTLEGDLSDGQIDLGIRAQADLLAAHLHTISRGTTVIELTDFDGNSTTVELDPRLAPHQNLERWYKRAGRAERKIEQVNLRLESAREELRRALDLTRAADALGDDATLDTWLEFASTNELGVTPAPSQPASQRGKPAADRLPYWRFEVDGFEIRVGRSARDNDELIKRHSNGRDLWFHAQGVTGSHVVLRTRGQHVTTSTLQRVAQIAAHHSRARTSATVPVLVTERRYVRKPRKAAPGQVTLERERTLFVEPKIPVGCERGEE